MMFRWNTQTAELIGQVELPRERFSDITSFAIHPSCDQLLTGHFDGVLRLWDIDTLFAAIDEG